jgi:16S rRNA U1498 N3-methylase RsmE
VDSITFLDCKNGERSHIRTDRIRKIAIGAAKQSRKTFPARTQRFYFSLQLVHKSKIQNPQSKSKLQTPKFSFVILMKKPSFA